jgi:hypothetical protein
VTIGIAAANIPAGTVVSLCAIGQNGGYSTATSSALSGTMAASTATASLTVPTTQPFVISASATYAITAMESPGPVYADGEAVDRIRVTSSLGGVQRVSYITRSGREVPVR